MEDDLKNKMEDNLQKNNGRQPKKKMKTNGRQPLKNLRNVIQDFAVLLTFSFKAYKHVLLLNGPLFVLSAKLNSTTTWCTFGHLFAHYTTTIIFCRL